jgi:hypothetical protein
VYTTGVKRPLRPSVEPRGIVNNQRVLRGRVCPWMFQGVANTLRLLLQYPVGVAKEHEERNSTTSLVCVKNVPIGRGMTAVKIGIVFFQKVLGSRAAVRSYDELGSHVRHDWLDIG